MAFLPAIGTLSYNSYTFTSVTKSHVNAKPVYDEAGRAVVYIIYSITVTAHIALPGGGDTATYIGDLRRRLLEPGCDLHYEGKGFSDLTINVGAAKDVAWGPKPTRAEFRPLGGNQAWMVIWSVDVAIPECTNAVYQYGILAFNYEANYHIDSDGYTQVAWNGYLEIPMTRAAAGARFLLDNVDNYRHLCSPGLPQGFRRLTQDFRMSGDKRRLDFTVVDEEMPVDGLPWFATNATGSHSINSEDQGFETWNGTIQAAFTIPKNYPKSLAWDVFFVFIQDRLNWLAQQIDPTGAKNFPMLMSLKFREGLFLEGRQSSFEVGYWFPATLFQILYASGLWRQVPNANWNLWATSIAPALGVRGYQQLRNLASDDAIVDLCGGSQPVLTAGGFQPPGGSSQSAFFTTCPPPESSWLHYENRLEFGLRTGLIAHKPLPQTNTLTTTTLENLQNPATPQTAILTAIAGLAAIGQGQGIPPPAIPLGQLQNLQGAQMTSVQIPSAKILQQASTPDFFCRMTGWALRACYHIPLPMLLTVGGAQVYPVNQDVEQDVPGNFGGVPVYRTSWVLEYLLKDLPGAGQVIPFPANLAQKVVG